MIPKECKRLAEVDFPIAVVSKHAAREKSIRHGHPSTLHLWWARRPLAACRAMLLGLLLPDPCDDHCPEEFKQKTRELLPKVQGEVGPKDEDLRKSLLKFIGDFANWDLSSDRTYLGVARGLVNAAHSEEPPLILDPFAGGGSIPLEGLRLGCESFAGELNPVACLILSVLLQNIPQYGPNFAEELRRLGDQIRANARNELAKFYPAGSKGVTPIAYLWARTVHCEAPKCGAEIPIFKTPWLSKKGAKRARYFREAADGDCTVLVMESTPVGGPIKFRIAHGEGKVNPQPGFNMLKATKAPGNNSNVICPCCNAILDGKRVMAQLAAQASGCDVVFDTHGTRVGGAFMLAVIQAKADAKGKSFRLPSPLDYDAVWKATVEANTRSECNPPDRLNPTRPSPNARGLTAPTRYGAEKFAHLFTARQRLAISVLAKIIRGQFGYETSRERILPAVLGLGRCVDQSSAHVSWIPNIEAIGHSFPRQALQMVWDFVESIPIGDQSANYGAAIEWIIKVVDELQGINLRSGEVQQGDAQQLTFPDESVDIYFTDPPYYDAVPYADLADFFLVWLKPALPPNDPVVIGLEGDGLSPKAQECVWNQAYEVDGKPKDPAFFERTIGRAFAEGRRVLTSTGIGCIVFAHKTTEGWEALLSGLLNAKWLIRASWPVVTERGVRTNAQNTASLASSVHLVCRPRDQSAAVGDWAEVHRALPHRVTEWMNRLQDEHIRGADLVFACIGPALEIYSRYSKVVDAEDRVIPLGGDPEATEPYKRGYLAYVWEAVGRAALEQVLGTAEATARNGAAGALEEDARLTALFLWTLQSTNGESSPSPSSSPVKGEEMSNTDDDSNDEEEEGETTSKAKKKKGLTLVFDVVRRFAQPLGIHLDNWEDRIIETEKGIVRLLPVAERGTQLFGRDGADLVSERLERESTKTFQLTLFPEKTNAAPKVRGKKSKGKKETDKDLRTNQEATTLDRVHAAMLLQASGRTNALRALLRAELDRGPDFLRLANALSALYPKESEEKRLLDAMLLAVPR